MKEQQTRLTLDFWPNSVVHSQTNLHTTIYLRRISFSTGSLMTRIKLSTEQCHGNLITSQCYYELSVNKCHGITWNLLWSSFKYSDSYVKWRQDRIVELTICWKHRTMPWRPDGLVEQISSWIDRKIRSYDITIHKREGKQVKICWKQKYKITSLNDVSKILFKKYVNTS